jgi:hypothetical protein
MVYTFDAIVIVLYGALTLKNPMGIWAFLRVALWSALWRFPKRTEHWKGFEFVFDTMGDVFAPPILARVPVSM